jgi:exodeoxyribonuclease V alpha subunit
VDPARLEALILQMAEAKELIIEQGYGDLAEHRLCYLPAFYHTEVALAKRLARFAEQPIEVDMARVGRWIDGYTAKKGITLSAEQRQAVELAASSRMLILTGGPGTGKTFTTKTVVSLWRAMDKTSVACCSHRAGGPASLGIDRARCQNDPPDAGL